jgi:hypothetical protein
MKRLLEWKDKFHIESIAAQADVSGLPCVKKQLCFHTITFTVCALLLFLVSGFVFQASGLNMWHLFVTWDNETMEMRLDKNGWKMRQEFENDMEQAFDDAFFQKLKEFEMYPLLPSWMPEGFILSRVESKIETEYYRWALGTYTCGDKQFYISVIKNISENSGGVWSLEKDEREPDIYEQGGIKFYIMDNLSRSHAFWFDLPYTISIAGHVTRDELKQMINSMFERN